MELTESLKKWFGHDSFREGQEDLIRALMSGRDILGVMPTGAGKSVCYQLPALLFPGITLVVSPLIALMKDQVMALKQSGVAAAYINSSLTPGQQQEAIRRAKNGAYKIIYVAPERLQTPAFLDFATHAPISLLAVDEAHCVSQWGQDFRPSYLKVPDFVRALPHRPPVAAFTATATQQVRRDMIRLLELEEPYTLVTGYNRPNLRFVSVKPTSKPGYLLRYLEEADPDACGIVYCSTRKNVEDVCEKLLLATGGIFLLVHHNGIQTDYRITLRLIIVGKFLYIFFYKIGIFLCFSSDAHSAGSGVLVDLSFYGKIVQIICIGHIVQIAVCFPFFITVSYFLVVALVGIVGILRKDQRTVHQRIDHYHDTGNYDHHRNQTLQQTFK